MREPGGKVKIYHIISSLTLVMFLTLPAFAFTGCGQKETAPATATPAVTAAAPVTTATQPVTSKTAIAAPPGQPELQQALAGSVAAMKKASAYRYVMNMNLKIDITGGTGAGKTEVKSIIGGDINQTTREMAVVTDMAINVNLKNSSPAAQNLSMQMYVLADKLYVNMELPPVGKQWLKIPLTEELRSAYNLNTVDQQLAPLESIKDLTFLRYETLDGSDCYVMTVTPDMQKILAWVGKDLPAELKADDLNQMAKMFKSLSYTLWIARDSGLIRNLDVAMRLEMSPDQFKSGATADFQNLALDVALTMKIFDHNKPVSIVLPPEARNALEIPTGKQISYK